jgi:glucose-1-phosphate cytidylyltransferase
LKRVAEYVKGEEAFCFTYGDGVSNVDIQAAITFHRQHGKLPTLTAVVPPGRYGAITREGNRITSFVEKPPGDGGLINGGFFVLAPRVLEWVEGDHSSWEGGALNRLAESGELMAYEHQGFWQPMDTLRDKNYLEELWQSGRAPWKVW